MTDLVTMLLVIGGAYYAYENGLLDELVSQLQSSNGGGGGGEEVAPDEPTEDTGTGEEAQPIEGDAGESGNGGGSDGGDKDSGDDKKKGGDKKSNYVKLSTYSTVPLNWV